MIWLGRGLVGAWSGWGVVWLGRGLVGAWSGRGVVWSGRDRAGYSGGDGAGKRTTERLSSRHVFPLNSELLLHDNRCI